MKNQNEFEPRFVQPTKPAPSGTTDMFVSNKMFTFKVAENQDFDLQVKAEDLDAGQDGQLVYNIEMINQDDEFIVHQSFDNLVSNLVPFELK